MASESVATNDPSPSRRPADIGDLIDTLGGRTRPGSLEHIQHCGQAAYNSLEQLWGGLEAIGELMEIAGDNDQLEVSPEAIFQLGGLMRMLSRVGDALTLTQANADFWEKNESLEDVRPAPPPEDFGPQHKAHMATALAHLKRADKIVQRVRAKREEAATKATKKAAA